MTLELQRLSDLSDDALAEAYAPPRSPWLRVNFVSTVDGAAQGGEVGEGDHGATVGA